jgi:hypothetical protein
MNDDERIAQLETSVRRTQRQLRDTWNQSVMIVILFIAVSAIGIGVLYLLAKTTPPPPPPSCGGCCPCAKILLNPLTEVENTRLFADPVFMAKMKKIAPPSSALGKPWICTVDASAATSGRPFGIYLGVNRLDFVRYKVQVEDGITTIGWRGSSGEILDVQIEKDGTILGFLNTGEGVIFNIQSVDKDYAIIWVTKKTKDD